MTKKKYRVTETYYGKEGKFNVVERHFFSTLREVEKCLNANIAYRKFVVHKSDGKYNLYEMIAVKDYGSPIIWTKRRKIKGSVIKKPKRGGRTVWKKTFEDSRRIIWHAVKKKGEYSIRVLDKKRPYVYYFKSQRDFSKGIYKRFDVKK